MKIILNDGNAFNITNFSVNHNAKVSVDEERDVIVMNVEDVSSWNVRLLKELLSTENLSSVKVKNSTETILKENLRLLSINEIITQDHHEISIKLTEERNI